jgi:hypothetical protein
VTLFEGGAGLELLGQIYKARGGVRSPDEVDFGSPIQFVHDVSRIVELGAATPAPLASNTIAPLFQGYLNTTHSVEVTANATDTWDSFLVDLVIALAIGGSGATIASVGQDVIRRYRAWICDITARANPNFTGSDFFVVSEEGAFRTDATANGPEALALLWRALALDTFVPIKSGGDRAVSPSIGMPIAVSWPRNVNNQIDLGVEVSAGAAAGRFAVFQFRWFVAPAGIAPPGMR